MHVAIFPVHLLALRQNEFKHGAFLTTPDEKLSHLVGRMALGDRHSLTELYKLEADRIFALLVRVVREREAAADLLHDVFVKLWTSAPQFNPARAPARVWMTTVARNTAIDHLRRFENARRVEMEPGEMPDASRLAVEEYMRMQDAERLRYCLEHLRPDWQHVIGKAYVEGHSYVELSRELGVPANTIKSWMRRALAQLRDCITAKD